MSVLENLTVELTVPLLGGKVHGSLARAGKVRGQTPKVTMIPTILILMILPCTTPNIDAETFPHSTEIFHRETFFYKDC